MSGGFNPVNMVSQVALAAATGGASLMVQAAMTAIVSAVAQQVIQQLGQQLGLPQSTIDIATSAAGAALGGAATGAQGFGQSVAQTTANIGSQLGFSPTQQGEVTRAADGLQQQLTNLGMDAIRNESNDRSRSATGEARAQNGAGKEGVAARLGITGGFLVALATAMGEVLDNKMNQLASLTEEMNGISEQQKSFGTVDKDSMAEFQSLGSDMQSISALLGGVSQELKVLSDALNTSVKSIGESQSTMARKS